MSEFETYLQKLTTVFTKLVRNSPAEIAERQQKASPHAYVLEALPVGGLAQIQEASLVIAEEAAAHTIYVEIKADSFDYLAPGMKAMDSIAIDLLNMIDLCCVGTLRTLDDLLENERSAYVLVKLEEEAVPRALCCIDHTQASPKIIDLTQHLDRFMALPLYQRFADQHFQQMFGLSKADLAAIKESTQHPPPCMAAPLTLGILQSLKPAVLNLIASNGHIVSKLEYQRFQENITYKYTQEYDAQAAHIRQETLILLEGLASDDCDLNPLEKRAIFMSCNDRGFSLGQVLLGKADQELMLGYLYALKKIGDAQCLRDIVLQNESSDPGISLHQEITSQDPQLIRVYLECLEACCGTPYFDELLTCQKNGEEILSMRLSRLVCEPDDEGDALRSFIPDHLAQLEKMVRPERLWVVLGSISTTDGNHLGQILAEDSDNEGFEAYLNLLEKRLQTPADADAVRWILMHVNEEGYSLLHSINIYQCDNRLVIEKQFSLLRKLSEILEGSVEEGEILTKEARFLDCLSVMNQQGLTPGHLIAQRKNPEDIRSYLTFIDGIQDPLLLVLFLQINQSGDNLGHLVAESAFKGQGIENVRCYLNILFKIYHPGELADFLLDELAKLLRQLSRDGFPFGVMIGRDCGSMRRYFDLLKRFEDESVFKELFFQETQIPFKYQHTKSHRSNHGLTVGHTMTRFNAPDEFPGFIMHVVTHLKAQDIILKFLKKETAGGETFLTLLAKHQSGHEISAIIMHLMAVIHLKDFLDLMHQENERGENFLSILITKHSLIRVRDLLNEILKGHNHSDLICFLKNFNFKDGYFTILNLIDNYNYFDAIKYFLEEVFFKINDADVLFKWLSHRNRNGDPFFHQVISPKKIHDSNCVSPSPGVILLFMRGVFDSLKIVEYQQSLMYLQDKSGNTAFHLLALYGTGKLQKDFCNVISLISQTVSCEELLSLVHQVNHEGENFLSLLVKHHAPETILFCIGLVMNKKNHLKIRDFLYGIDKGILFVKNNHFDAYIDCTSNDFTLVDCIVSQRDPGMTADLLENILFAMKDVDAIFRVMTSCDDNGNPLMHRVMTPKWVGDQGRNLQHEDLIGLFIKNLMDCVRGVSDIDVLLSATDTDGNNILHVIAGHANVKLILDCINIWSTKFNSLRGDSEYKEICESMESISADYCFESFELRSQSISSAVSGLDGDDDSSLMVNDSESVCSEKVSDFEMVLSTKNKNGKSFQNLLDEHHGLRLIVQAEGEYGLTKVQVSVDVGSFAPSKTSSSSLSSMSSGGKCLKKTDSMSPGKKTSSFTMKLLAFQYK